MKIIKHGIPKMEEMTIEEFGDKYGIDLHVRERERPGNEHMKWYASFESLEIKDGSMLQSVHGNGYTPESAIETYCNEISGKYLVIRAYHKQFRQDIWPVIVTPGDYVKLLNANT